MSVCDTLSLTESLSPIAPRQAREKGAELINSVGGLREQIVALGQNLEEANATATAVIICCSIFPYFDQNFQVIGCGDEELLGTLGPLSGSILSLCEQVMLECYPCVFHRHSHIHRQTTHVGLRRLMLGLVSMMIATCHRLRQSQRLS